MKQLNKILETFRTVAKHEQGVRKQGQTGPEKSFKGNTIVSKKGNAPAESQASQEFVDDHEVKVTPDANGNGNDVFNASNITTNDRKKSRHGYDAKESEEVNEMSKAQMGKREEIVKSMKKNFADFKKRYGEDAKSVMYATATKQAMKEETVLDEGADAQKRFHEYHSQIEGLMKGIQSSLATHKTTYGKNAHWGNVGDVSTIHDQLRDIHDRLAEKGEYAKEMAAHQKKMNQMSKMMKEDVDQEEQKFDCILEAVRAHKEEQELVEAYAAIIESLYEGCETEEEKQQLMDILESDDAFDQLVEMVESATAESDKE